ncbi:MAG: TonB-dependent siderophore receptor [Cyanobacteria bacterium P01_F01_bin.86]
MIKLWQGLLLAGTISVLGVQAARAEAVGNEEVGESGLPIRPSTSQPAPTATASETEPTDESAIPIDVSTVRQIEAQPPATTVDEWVAQIEASLIQITDVRVEETEAGLQVILETAEGELAAPTTQTVGNALIADIPNALLALPEGDSFEAFGPAEGIALVSVTNEPGDQVRVAITGTEAPPVAEVNATGLAVTLGEVVAGAEDDAIQVVVTGEGDEGYNPSNASTATRTDTPIRDTPFSIQVVPQQVLEDRNVRTITEAVETVSGVVEDFVDNQPSNGARRIRGFRSFNAFRNGLRDLDGGGSVLPLGVVERVEVLKGPASFITGAIEPGGVINYVTKQPLSEPFYELGLEVGNFGRYEPSVDLSGPLTTDGDVLYRFIASYGRQDSFQDFVNTEEVLIAPSLSFNIGDRTDLALFYEYSRYFGDPLQTPVPLLSDGSLPDQDFYTSYPDFSENELFAHRAGYDLTYELSENWQIRNNFTFKYSENNRQQFFPISITDDRFLNFLAFDSEITNYAYSAGVNLVGEFDTGSIAHRLLTGFDFSDIDENNVEDNVDLANVPPLDILNPDYDAFTGRPELNPFFTVETRRRLYGFYLQNQIAFTDSLKLLIGGRYDWIEQEQRAFLPDSTTAIFSQEQSDGAFSPRIGLVYQPSDTVSLYGSYSRSFNQVFGQNPDNEPFEPTRGTQYEVGVKADFLDGRLSATLAAYNLTQTNVLTPDSDPVLAALGFSEQVGEQRSRGVELDVTGEILPGWNIVASYALTDTEVTEDNSDPSNEGNRFENVPLHQASIWTTYEIQEGDLQGLGFGLGLFYVGERQGDLANSFQVGDYLRTDAALYYRRNRFNAALNFRNLFDIDYISSVSFGSRLQVERGDPFTVVGSVSWEF